MTRTQRPCLPKTPGKNKVYTTTTTRKSFGKLFWPQHKLSNLVATIHFSPFTCCFRSFFWCSFTSLFRDENAEFTESLLCIHNLNSRANGSLIAPITHIHIFTPITRVVATKLSRTVVDTENPIKKRWKPYLPPKSFLCGPHFFCLEKSSSLKMGKMVSICHLSRALPASMWGHCSQVLVLLAFLHGGNGALVIGL